MIRFTRVVIVCLALVIPVMLEAQEKPGAALAPPSSSPLVGIKVQLVLARYQGDKKISSMPYTLQLTSNERATTSLRMGTEVPIATGAGGYNYRAVGTNIDCRAETVVDGTYKLHVTIEDSSVRLQDPEKTERGAAEPGAHGSGAFTPAAFRSFRANFVILLRDGQTAQYTSATDPASGEVLKVDATLNVLK